MNKKALQVCIKSAKLLLCGLENNYSAETQSAGRAYRFTADTG